MKNHYQFLISVMVLAITLVVLSSSPNNDSAWQVMAFVLGYWLPSPVSEVFSVSKSLDSKGD